MRGATGHERLTVIAVGFQSTHPVRGATHMNINWKLRLQFQSTHPVRGATKYMLRDCDDLEIV